MKNLYRFQVAGVNDLLMFLYSSQGEPILVCKSCLKGQPLIAWSEWGGGLGANFAEHFFFQTASDNIFLVPQIVFLQHTPFQMIYATVNVIQ